MVGVSSDTQQKADEFRRQLDLPFPLVGDSPGAVLRAYRVRWPLIGWARRVSYVVGTDGIIQDAFHSERAPHEHVARACAIGARPGPA